MEIVFLTGNANKLAQLKKYFPYEVHHQDVDLPEIQSLDSDKIIEHKAREAYARIQQPVLVEDMSLRFAALGNLPGPLIKWFLEELGTEGLCKLVATLGNPNAYAEVTYGLFDGTTLQTFRAGLEGTIAPEPRGENIFGWNPIFIPNGWTKTLAEMNDEESGTISMRRRALQQLQEYLDSQT